MIRCAACGSENADLADRCAGCGADLAATLVREALATEVCCPACRTAVPPASRFCGVCGARLAAAGEPLAH
jgi:rRNA maturation endonuclease Nob1